MMSRKRNISASKKRNKNNYNEIILIVPIFCLSQIGVFASNTLKKDLKNNIINKQIITMKKYDGDFQADKPDIIHFAKVLGQIVNLDYSVIIDKTNFCRYIQLVDDNFSNLFLIVFVDEGGYVVFNDTTIISCDVGNFNYLISEKYVLDKNGEILILDDFGHTSKIDLLTGNPLFLNNVEKDLNLYDEIDGEITNSILNNYISEQHSTWNLIETKKLGGYTRKQQFDTSFYVMQKTFKDGHTKEWYSEGNCAVNAMSNYFLNLPYVTTPSGAHIIYNENFSIGNIYNNRYSLFDHMNDILSYQYTNNDYPYIDNEEGKLDSEICVKQHYQLRPSTSIYWNQDKDTYWFVRSESIKKGYTPIDGFDTRTHGEYVMEKVANDYFSTNLDIYYTTSTNDVVSNIENGIPVVVSARGSSSYHNHGMVIYGYKKYQYQETKIGFLWIPYTVTKYAYMWLVDDNWSLSETWYDSYKSTNNVFLCTERSSLLWPSC